MTPSTARAKKSPKQGMRALSACGDGFWELDLLDGTAWFSDWFYRKLNWTGEIGRSRLQDLKEAVGGLEWDGFMEHLRAHLERADPLDIHLRVKLPGNRQEWWHFKGSTERTAAGLPIYVAGSARVLDAGRAATACWCGAFDALPVAAALIDAGGTMLRINPRWRSLPPAVAEAVAGQLKGATAAALDLTLEPDAASPEAKAPDGARRVTARAVAFEEAGTHRWIAILENA